MNNLDLNAGLDLNVENYELSDLLNLFKLDIEFDENDMRYMSIGIKVIKQK